MNKKWMPPPYVIVIGICALVLVAFLAIGPKSKSGRANPGSTRTQQQNDPASSPDRDHGFDRRVSYIEYTKHAKCRMECRKISQAEVEEIMKEGEINYRKSDVKAKPCPAYAVEGVTRDNQRVRIVFGQCDQKTKVITCIDLDTDWECHCPGDDDKYKNRN